MTATLCLIGCLLAPAQAPDRPAPRGARRVGRRTPSRQGPGTRLPRLLHRTGRRRGVQFNRAFRIETALSFFPRNPGRRAPTWPSSPSLKPRSAEQRPGRRRTDGRVGAAGAGPRRCTRAASRPTPASRSAVPLEGPPTLECGAFAVVPDGRVAADATWETAEEGRPMRTWRAPGAKQIDGERCVKLEGVQKSDDWDEPRGRPPRLRRTDTVRLAPGLGVRLPRGARRRTPRTGPPRPDLQGRARQPGELDAVHRPALRGTPPRDHAGPRLRRRRRPAADDAGQYVRSSPPS